MQISETPAPQAGQEPCRFPKLEECAHFHYEKVQLGPIMVQLQTQMDQSLHSQHGAPDDTTDWYTLQVTSREECWLIQRSFENFTMLDSQLHQCIYDRKVSQLGELTMDMSDEDNLEIILMTYLQRFCSIIDNSLNCGPILNWFQLDNRGHRLLVPSEESRSINTPAVAAAYSVRKYVSQARDELSLEVGDMISVIDMASPGESMWWRGKRGFQVGFFPQHCVHIIGDKVPRNMPLPPPVVGSLAISPIKPVLRKHGKLITFFRSFILNRPSRRRLKQSGILRERVFGCDLGEHLLNSGHDIPMVLKCCAEFIERNGIVDGIYRLSGVTSNIQKLRNAFDEDRVPNLYTDDILQDIHSVASLLKMYFRELPNPLCTYQLYSSFVAAVQGCREGVRNKSSDNERLLKMREAVQKLPPPHYRTLEYLMRHLAKVAKHGASTGMTTRNVAIVWAPNLLRCEELEVGGVAALQGVGVQAVVTEFLICYADLIFSDHLPNLSDTSITEIQPVSPKRCRPKSLAISTPTKLLTLEEARNKHLLNKNDEGSYIEVGGGPKNLPKKYHTIIELPAGSRKRSLTKRSPSGWRSFFSKSRNNSHGNLSKHIEISPPGALLITEKSVTEMDLTEIKRKLRPVKSAESLTSGQSEPTPCENDVLGPLYTLNKPPGHNRSVSHDSYFDNLQSSQNNSVGSLLDLSEIQLNFDLEESEMRIFSEDESLVSSPKVQRETTRKLLSRARPEEFSSAANSSNPSPKKQARVVISPESLSRKRSRIEDQLSDIQYIDCNTPDNSCLISTTAVIHNQEDDTCVQDQYQPKNKSPRNSHALNRHSLNFDTPEKIPSILPKSKTEMDIEKIKVPNSVSSGFNLTPGGTPGTPNYKPLDNTSSDTTPILSPDLSPDVEIRYQNLSRMSDGYPLYENEETRPKSCYSLPEKRVYENVPSKSESPTYENILTTISITYRSPVKTRASDSIYEDVELNPEKAVVPTTIAELPKQEAMQPDIERPNNLDINADNTEILKTCDDDESNGFKSATYKSIGSVTSTPISLRSPIDPENSKKSLISPTEVSITEIISESSPETSASLSPIVKHSDVIRSKSTSSLSTSSTGSSPVNLSTSASLGAISPADAQTHNTSSNNSLSDALSPASPEPIVTTIGSTDEQSSPSFSKFNDKRKSCDDEILDDRNAIYQQVKYFRRSIHEINSLLDMEKVEAAKSKPESSENILDGTEDNQMDSIENFDSLEADNNHVYENVDTSKKHKDLDVPRSRMHESEPKKIEITAEEVQELPVCSKCLPTETEQISNVKILTNKFEKTKDETTDEVKEKKTKNYDKDGLPPCLRAKNAKNSVKTKSLDENAFITEFGRSPQQLTRRKSLDDRTSSYINSKLLVEPKPPSRSTLDVSQIDKKIECPITEQKLNRERIEKYKEERRNYLREKYRSESFREDKDKVLSRLKQKSFRKTDDKIDTKVIDVEHRINNTEYKIGTEHKLQNDAEQKICNVERKVCSTDHKINNIEHKINDLENKVNNIENNSEYKEVEKRLTDVETKVVNSYKKLSLKTLSKFEGVAAKPPKKHHSPLSERRNKTLKELSDKLLDDTNDDISITCKEEEEFIRHRRGDGESEKKRHTFELNREREFDSETHRRISLESRIPRKEKCSPSYCIKDMKAIFEPKTTCTTSTTQQNQH